MLAALFFGLSVAVSSQAAAATNVLIVVADDVAERDIDGLATPRFDQLAAQGLRFRRAYSNPTCSPARWSLTFGQYHAVDAGLACLGGGAERAPDPDQVSLPRLFREAGYRTALFGKWHLGFHPETPGEEARWERAAQVHGYQTWRAGMPANVSSCGGKSYTRWLRLDDGAQERSHEYNTDAILEACLAWLEAQESAQGEAREPWFAMVCFQAPHGPFHVPPEHAAGLSEGDQRKLGERARYELMMTSFDVALGRILDRVDLTRTLVLVVGDNGTPEAVPGPRQVEGRLKGTTFEDGIRVPMVWAGPGVAEGRESDALVHFVDVLPTLADRLGVSLDSEVAGLHGLSLRSVLEEPGAPVSTPVHAQVWCGVLPTSAERPADFAVVTPRYKYRAVGEATYLFDLSEDPREDHNLAGDPEQAERCLALSSFLDAHRPANEPRGRERSPNVDGRKKARRRTGD